MSLANIKNIIENVETYHDELEASNEELAKVEHLNLYTQIRQDELNQQINLEEAKHKSVFVAGWRPFIGWVGGLTLAYQFLLYPLFTWAWASLQAAELVPKELTPPPVIDSEELWVVITGMLGIAGMRSFDKFKGTQTDKINTVL